MTERHTTSIEADQRTWRYRYRWTCSCGEVGRWCFQIRSARDGERRHVSAAAQQPTPIKNDSTPIAELVLADVSARRELGRARYGTDLQAHNGRDDLRDAYEEALDLVFYLRQALEERR